MQFLAGMPVGAPCIVPSKYKRVAAPHFPARRDGQLIKGLMELPERESCISQHSTYQSDLALTVNAWRNSRSGFFSPRTF